MPTKFDESTLEKCQGFRDSVQILLATVTPEETISVHQRLQPIKGHKHPLMVHHGADVYYLGQFGFFNAVHVVSKQGSSGTYAVSSILSKALEVWSPKAVVMPGIAFGMQDPKQKLGDILISEAIRDYTYGKVEGHWNEETFIGAIMNRFSRPKFTSRGREIPCGTILFSKFTAHGVGDSLKENKKIKTYSGLVLSANILLNSKYLRNKLRKKYDDAIGGEMEGHALASICSGRKLEWIVVKSICDFGDGKKKDGHHTIASENSAELCKAVFSQLYPFEGLNIRSVNVHKTTDSRSNRSDTIGFQQTAPPQKISARNSIDRTNPTLSFNDLFGQIASQFKNVGPALQKDIVMLLAEYISNVFEHGGADRISYSVGDNEITVSDNGQSFDPFDAKHLKTLKRIPGKYRGVGLGAMNLIKENNKYNFNTTYRTSEGINTLSLEFGKNVRFFRSTFVITLEDKSPFDTTWIKNLIIPETATEIDIIIPKDFYVISGLMQVIDRALDFATKQEQKVFVKCHGSDLKDLQKFLDRYESEIEANKLVIVTLD